jgi:hypothetical protein
MPRVSKQKRHLATISQAGGAAPKRPKTTHIREDLPFPPEPECQEEYEEDSRGLWEVDDEEDSRGLREVDDEEDSRGLWKVDDEEDSRGLWEVDESGDSDVSSNSSDDEVLHPLSLHIDNW